MAVQVIPLKCPSCKAGLCGFDRDSVFFCAYCRMGWEFGAEGNPRPLQMAYAKPLLRPDKFKLIFYLPFYHHRVSLVSGSEYIPEHLAAELPRRFANVYVPGYRLIRESYFGELGLIYTESGVILEEDLNVPEKERCRIGAAIRAPAETEPYLKYYPLLIIDKRSDITGKNFEFQSWFQKIWAVPFYDLGEQIQEGITGKTFPAISLDSISEFRESG